MKLLEFEDRRPLKKKTRSDKKFVAAVDRANQDIAYDETQLENKDTNDQWIVVRRKPGEEPKKVGGPYTSVKKARTARDKKDTEYGAAVHQVKRVDNDSTVLEAVRRLPLSDQDFDTLKEVINHPIPATLAGIYLQDLIEDDELDGQIADIESRDPGQDIRFLVVEWIKRVMPDQHHRFFPEQKFYNRTGTMSVVHGYDPHQYRGTNPAITGNAYGRF